MDVSLVQSFHLFVELKTFKAHGSKRLFVDAYTPSTLCGRKWVSRNRHLFLFYFETQLVIGPRSPNRPWSGNIGQCATGQVAPLALRAT
jgi:hypothetical protein